MNTIVRRVFRVTVLLSALLVALPVYADIVLTLPNAFIEKYKNRATIETDFEIFFATQDAQEAESIEALQRR